MKIDVENYDHQFEMICICLIIQNLYSKIIKKKYYHLTNIFRSKEEIATAKA